MLRIFEDSKNYTAQVVKLPVKQTVVGLDNLCKVNIQGNDCLISKDSPEDELYLFFPAECQLSEQFLKKNNLYRDTTLNEDSTKKGYFEPNGRCKTMKFKGVISTCFVIPLISLHSLFQKSGKLPYFNIGDEFNEIDGVEICRKYISAQKTKGSANQPKLDKTRRFDKCVPNQFRFHQDTSHLAKNLHLFNPSDIIVITDKWHGTSAVFSNVLINKELKWYEKILKKIGINIIDKEYGNLYASRSVIKNKYINKTVTLGFYNEDIWGTVNKQLDGKIEQGITIFGEIVGFLTYGKHIQRGYDYGCGENQHKFVVYRITYTKPDGNVIEFSWQQIKDYCKKYELETVKELYFGRLSHFTTLDFFDALTTIFLEKECQYCVNKVPAEGICVRIDGKESYMTYKLKSKNFLLRESKELDAGETNIEDNQDDTEQLTEQSEAITS